MLRFRDCFNEMVASDGVPSKMVQKYVVDIMLKRERAENLK